MFRFMYWMFFFFFQAEDGIRDADVTGVQTCALPIWAPGASGPQPGTMGGPWSQPGGSPPGNGGGWAWTPQTSGFASQYGYRPTEPTQAFQADPSDTRITDPVLAASCLVFRKFEAPAA